VAAAAGKRRTEIDDGPIGGLGAGDAMSAHHGHDVGMVIEVIA
jgi:hypothetical protein